MPFKFAGRSGHMKDCVAYAKKKGKKSPGGWCAQIARNQGHLGGKSKG